MMDDWPDYCRRSLGQICYLAELDLVAHGALDAVDVVVHHREGDAHRKDCDDLEYGGSRNLLG